MTIQEARQGCSLNAKPSRRFAHRQTGLLAAEGRSLEFKTREVESGEVSDELFNHSMSFAVTFVCSCDDQPFLELEKCVSDGANLYVKCFDGRQKVVELGYGIFYVIQDNTFPKAIALCDDNPERVVITLRNADSF